MRQQFFRRLGQYRFAILDQTCLLHQVHIDVPEVGMEIHRHAVDTAFVADG